jgi:uroporphyrinogen-III synthase
VRVIVTRVQPQAQAWVGKLHVRGHDALALPLIEVHGLSDTSSVRAAWKKWHEYAAAMFVSSHAVDFFFKEKSVIALDLSDQAAIKTRVWATGPGTAKALLAQGVAASLLDMPSKEAGQFDSESLWRVVGSQVRIGERVLIVRGDSVGSNGASLAEGEEGVGRDWLAQRLAQSGVEVEFVVAYARAAPVWQQHQLGLAQRAASDGSVWLFSSAEAVAQLRTLLPLTEWSQAYAVATHPRIADAARRLGFGLVRTSRPTLEDVVSSIESIP